MTSNEDRYLGLYGIGSEESAVGCWREDGRTLREKSWRFWGCLAAAHTCNDLEEKKGKGKDVASHVTAPKRVVRRHAEGIQ